MSPLTEPTRFTLAKTYVGIDDPDAANYIALVEAADTAAGSPGGLETATKVAIHSFVKGCKADGIWPAIKASCILAGARTLAGALVPLAGTPPTKFGTEGNWNYNRKGGLQGAGINYLNSNTAILSAWQDNAHVSVYTSTGGNGAYIGALNAGATAGTQMISDTFLRLNSSSSVTPSNFAGATGLVGLNRNSPSSINFRVSSATVSLANTSTTPATENLFVFARNFSNPSQTNARLAFYSIGESLNLALLDARVTDLINAFGAAIP